MGMCLQVKSWNSLVSLSPSALTSLTCGVLKKGSFARFLLTAPAVWHLQGWGFNHLPGQPVLCLIKLSVKKFPLIIPFQIHRFGRASFPDPEQSVQCAAKRNTQRKRRGGAVNARQARKRNRLVASTAEMASEAEPIEVEESAGEEVVDLTCESSEPVVVDLTHNDSVVIVEENQRPRRNLRLRSQRQSDSCVLSSDDEDETRDNDVYVTNKVSRELGPLEDETAGSKPSGTVSCPICMDGYSEIVQSGRLIVSTKCGHVFCSQCLRDSLRNANSCPTCRKKLNHRQYHPIYI
ncbi:E3 ubiquitin-protein ligase RNF4 isoform X1 [Melanerpes formicivorus]|uniref:E3 ubiquitin-protein ligase RNF4 isoform X1 n=1 Tax=Melanerpes formicivorus TaxID=211600 RepID=UPI00358EA1D9